MGAKGQEKNHDDSGRKPSMPHRPRAGGRFSGVKLGTVKGRKGGVRGALGLHRLEGGGMGEPPLSPPEGRE